MNRYPVVWRGETYYMYDLAIEMKNEFVEWCKQELTREGIKNLSSKPDMLSAYFAGVYAQCWWADGGMSKLVHDMMHSFTGGRQFNRILFRDTIKKLSDSDVDAMLAEKEADETSDYMVALTIIRAHADPKAKAGATGADPAAGTSSTATTATTPSTRAA